MNEARQPDRVDFSRIRYAQCWEDADVLLRALRPQETDCCLSIASAGDNTLALVAAGARRVIAVDLSPAQIACLELRVAAYRCLTHAELLELIGQSPSSRRGDYYRRCRGLLPGDARRFWDARPTLVERGIGRAGKFERYLGLFRRFVLPLIHTRSRIERLFELQSVEERRVFFEQQWNNRRWNALCRRFFGHAVLGRLGRDPQFTTHADEPVWQSLSRRVPVALVEQDPNDNPYLQWILTGRFRTRLPFALRPENFAAIRDNLDALEVRCAPLQQVVAELPVDTLNACNLSDLFEYLPAAEYEALLQALVHSAAPGCRLVYWNLVVDRRRPRSMSHLIREQRGLAQALHRRDHAFFYRDLIIEEVH